MSRNRFTEVDLVRDPDNSGVVAVISKRDRPKGAEYSFALMKEFERNGTTERTAFMQRRHVDGANRLLELVSDRLDALEDEERARRRA